MTIFTRTKTRAAAAALLGLLLTGCTGGGSGGSEDTAAAEGDGPALAVYNGASGQFVQNFNPLSPTVLANVRGMVYEPLFAFNNLVPLDTPATPLLGEEYSFDEEGRVLTVTLKSDVTWSDGEPFTAEDVAFTMNLIRDTPELNTTGSAPAAEVVDETTVTLTYDQPSFTEAPTTLGQTYIVPEHIFADIAEVTTDVNENPVGTGPMLVGDFTAQSYQLVRNPDFRDAADVAVPSVRVLSLSGNEAATNALLAGEIDWGALFVPDIDQVLQAAPDVTYLAAGSQQVVLNTCANADLGCTGPQTSSAVRQAIYQAIDREQVNQLAYYGNAGPISPTFALLERDEQFIAPEYSGPAPMSPDVEEARRLLEEDGWAEGADGVYAKDGERLSMPVVVTSGYTDYIATLQAMTQQLAAAGIEITVQQAANNEVISASALGDFQLAISGIFQGPVGDPYYIYNNSFNSAGTGPVGESINPYGNVTRFASPVVDEAIAEAASTDDLDEKAAAYAEIQSVIVEEMPYIPVINATSLAEYSTAGYTGWPTEEDLYASANPNTAPDNGVVLTRLQPRS